MRSIKTSHDNRICVATIIFEESGKALLQNDLLSQGFTEGQLVYEKDNYPEIGTLFIIKEIKDEVVLHSFELIPGITPKTVSPSFALFLQDWAIFKGKTPKAVHEGYVKKMQNESPSQMIVDKAQVGLFNALVDFNQKYGMTDYAEKLMFAAHPTTVYAKQALPPYYVTFVPWVPMGSIRIGGFSFEMDTGSVVHVDNKKLKLFLADPTVILPAEYSKERTSAFETKYVHPFFWMWNSRKAGAGVECNMKMMFTVYMGYTFPIMYNVKEIKQDEQLLLESAQTVNVTVSQPCKKSRITK